MGTLKRGFETNASTAAVLTNGQAASSAASGGTQTNGTQTYQSAAKFEGNLGLSIQTTAAQATITRFALAGTASLQFSGALAFAITVLPTATFNSFAALRGGGGTALRLTMKPAGTLFVRGQGTTTKEVQIPGTYTAGKMYVATIVAQAATTTTGSFTVKVYDAATKALVGQISGTDFDLGTTAFAAFDVGFINSDPQIGQKNYYDALTLIDGSQTEVLPDSWQATGLAASMWDGSAIQPGVLRNWDGTALSELASVSVA